MVYDLVILEDARRALLDMSPEVARRIVRKIERLRHDLAGDVKRLKAMAPNYRLRVGDWRVLFDVNRATITVHEVEHRSEAYD